MTSWTDEQVAVLKRRWAEGASASVIANEIGGVTRNAVIGKVHRIGLAGRGARRVRKNFKCIRTGNGAARAAQVKPFTPRGGSTMSGPPMVQAPLPPPDEYDDLRRAAGLVSLLELENHQCRWSLAYHDRLGHAFCGARSAPGLPYCEGHARRAWVPPTQARPGRSGVSFVRVGATTEAAAVQEFLEPV